MDLILANVIKGIRLQHNLTIKQFIEKIRGCISPAYVTKIERHGEIPSPELVIKIADAFGLNRWYLLQISKANKLTLYKLKLEYEYAEVLKSSC